MIGLVVVILVQIAIDRGVVPALSRHFEKAKAPLAIMLSALTIVLAGVSGAYIVETGHAGAKLTFGDEASEAESGAEEPGAEEPGAEGSGATEPATKESGAAGAEGGEAGE